MKAKQIKEIKSQSKNQVSNNKGPDALEMLKQDHKKVRKLFQDFENIHEDEESDGHKSEIVKQICMELTIHARLEEEIFYPAVRELIDENELMDEAAVEHAGAKALVAQLEAMDLDDDYYDAKVIVLGEQIDHHITEEENEMFPQIEKARMDTLSLGQEMMERKEQLEEELGIFDGTSTRRPLLMKKASSRPLHH